MSEDNIMHRFVSGSKGGKAGGGGSTRVAQEAPNTLQSKATLRVVEFLSEGEIEGLVDGAKSIYFDDTPLQNPDGTYNFSGINFEMRNGTPDQEHVAGFSSVEDEIPVGVKVTQPIPIVRTITDADIDAVRVTIRLPALTEQDTTNGDLNGSSVQFKIEYQPNGGSYIEAVSPTQGTITGKTTSPYERQYRINLTGNAPWNIRVTRITADNTAASIQNDLYWASYTRILDDKLIYPDTALAALSVDSSLFGANIPQRSYDIYGVKWDVPSNYDPDTREYTGVWDGTFVAAWTDNPAWILYGLITNKRFGLGDYIDAAEVDKYGLYTIAQYCDELVDDGAGGEEPRFTFNYVIETQDEALRILQLISTAFRGMLYWGAEGTSGIITAVHDAPRDAVKIFGPANVIGGMFTYSSSAAEARHSAVQVTWNDPAQGYAPAIEVVESTAILDMKTYRMLPVVAYGCTSRGQAHRFGKWVLDSELYEDELVQFSVGLADADIRPGDVIKVQDPAYADVRFSGRLIAGGNQNNRILAQTGDRLIFQEGSTMALDPTVGDFTLDDTVDLEAGQSYTIDVVMPDGTVESHAVTNSPGITQSITIGTVLNPPPDPLAMWVITGTDLQPRQFRVLGVKETNAAEFEVLAMLYDQNKYARVEQDIYLPSGTFTKLESGQVRPPTELTYVEAIISSGALVRSAVTISWKASPDSRVVRYELEAKRPGVGSNYELARSTNGLTHTIEGTIDGTWGFRVRAFDALGTPSAYLEIASATLSINGTPPDDVGGFSITNLAGTSILSWNAVTNKNLSHYEIRFANVLTGADWNSSLVVVESVPAGSTSVSVASRTGTFLIKAVTLPTATYPQGVYSQNAMSVIVDVDFLQTFNFVENLVEDPGFTGTKTNTVVNAGNLELTDTGGVFDASGTYEFHDIIDLGDVYTCRATPTIVASGNSTTNLVDDWVNVDEILNVDGATDGQWAIDFEVSTTPDDPGGSPVWSAWSILDAGDITARAFRFRVTLYSYFATVTPSIEELSVQLDMPDIIQSGEELASSNSTDTVVTFPFAYRSTRPAVVITPQGMATGDYVDLDAANISETGFTFNIRNSGGTRVARTFDYHAKGYGRLTP